MHKIFVMLLVIAALRPMLITSSAKSYSENKSFNDIVEVLEQKLIEDNFEQVAPNKLEQRFYANFPGTFKKFKRGNEDRLIRVTSIATRKMHPSKDCFLASNYKIEKIQIVKEQQKLWNSFNASKTGIECQVIERYYSANDDYSFSDVSAWYFHAATIHNPLNWISETRIKCNHAPAK